MTEQITQEFLNRVPALKKAEGNKTLRDYFARFYSAELSEIMTSDTRLLADVIVSEAIRLNPMLDAESLKQQLLKDRRIDMGAHLSLVKINDEINFRKIGQEAPKTRRGQTETYLFLLAVLQRQLGNPFSISILSGGRLAYESGGAGAFGIGPLSFPTTLTMKEQKSTLENLSKLPPLLYDERSVKLTALMMAATSNEMTLQSCTAAIKSKIMSLLMMIRKPENTIQEVYTKFFENLAQDKGLDEVLSQIDVPGQNLFKIARESLSSPQAQTAADQISLGQAAQLTHIFKPLDIQQICLHETTVTREFLVRALRDPRSIFYKLFLSYETLLEAARGFGEAEFKTFFKPYDKQSDILEEVRQSSNFNGALLKAIEDKKIGATTELSLMTAFLSGFIGHGGFFQSAYAPSLLAKLQKMFDSKSQIGQMLRLIQGDLCLLSLCTPPVGTTLPDIGQLSVSQCESLAEKVLTLPLRDIITASAPVVVAHLDMIAPKGTTLVNNAKENSKGG